MAHAFFLGVDLEDHDGTVHATLSMLEKEQAQAGNTEHFRFDHIRSHTAASVDALADSLQRLIADQPYIGRTNLIVHRGTDEGQALVEALTERGLDPIAATLTGGEGAVPGDPGDVGVHLGIVDAVRTLAELYRDGRVVIEDRTTEAASTLARALQRAAEALDAADADQDTPEAAGHSLEALADPGSPLTSAALAAWCGTERSFDPSQHLKEHPQTQTGDGTMGR